MSLTAAASGFVVFLLSVQVIQGQDEYGVSYSSTEICALKGSTVDMRCTYTYPYWENGHYTKVKETFWFTKERYQHVDLRTDSDYQGRVEYRCYEKSCTLRITDLRESDSAEYKFRFITNQPDGRYSGSPGVTLRVTDLQVKVTASTYSSWRGLKCHSSCRLPARASYIWYKNGQKIQSRTSSTYSSYLNSADSFSCAVKGHEDFPSPPVYAPKLPSVSVSPAAEIVEGSSVTLTCSSDANPAANYTWYEENGDPDLQPLSKEPQLVFSSIQSSDSGEYYCTAENELGSRTSEYIYINVTYAPRLPSVSVSPSGKIMEGSSVNLTCSSDANPAAKYTWYKENQTLIQGPEGIYHFSSIRSEDRGNYYCKSENQYGEINSSSLFIDVQYAPRLPSVSVSPSARIVEGSSVNLTCSSDANPAAKYTWYKENEDSPKTSGHIFTITDIRAEHSGNYYCEAQNRRGRHNSTSQLIIVSRSMKSVAAGSTTAILLVIICLFAFFFIRQKRSTKRKAEGPDNSAQPNVSPVYDNHSAAAKRNPSEEQDDLYYATVSYSKNQEDPLYSNVGLAHPNRQQHEEEEEEDEDEAGVEYTMVNFKSSSASPELRCQEDSVEDLSALYSTVTKRV